MTVPLDVGDLVRLRGREWVVEALKPAGTTQELSTVELACIADDAQGETLRAMLESEIDVRLVQDDLWQQIGREGSDDPKCLPRTCERSPGGPLQLRTGTFFRPRFGPASGSIRISCCRSPRRSSCRG